VNGRCRKVIVEIRRIVKVDERSDADSHHMCDHKE
jgi:hypothetical protein